MMTVVLRGRRARRMAQHPNPMATWGGPVHERSPWQAWEEQGSAKPGRGGRRKRRRRAAGSRAFIEYRMTGRMAALERTCCLLPLSGVDPSDLGRRERRRRAKLRRRRARRRSGWTTIPMGPGMWRALALHWMFKKETQRLREEMLTRWA